MVTVQSIRHSEVWVWMLVCLLAMFLVLAVLARVAGAEPGEPQDKPVPTYIVSPGPLKTGDHHAKKFRGRSVCPLTSAGPTDC